MVTLKKSWDNCYSFTRVSKLFLNKIHKSFVRTCFFLFSTWLIDCKPKYLVINDNNKDEEVGYINVKQRHLCVIMLKA